MEGYLLSTAYSEQPLDQLQDLELKLAQIKLQYSGFTVFTLSYIIEQEIVDVIHNKMRAAKVSNKIIETTYLEKRTIKSTRGGGITFFIKSDYVSEKGFPVAVMIEKGRKAYDVNAKAATPSRPNPHLKFLIAGVPKYRKKVKIPIKPAGRYIVDTIRQQKPVVIQRFNDAYSQWIQSILKS